MHNRQKYIQIIQYAYIKAVPCGTILSRTALLSVQYSIGGSRRRRDIQA